MYPMMYAPCTLKPSFYRNQLQSHPKESSGYRFDANITALNPGKRPQKCNLDLKW